MAVNRAQIIQAESREHVPGKKLLLQLLLDTMPEPIKIGINPHNSPVTLLKSGIAFTQAHPAEHFCHAADVSVDGHGIVIENNDNRFQACRYIFDSFISEATCKCSVPYDRTDVIVFLQKGSRFSHTEGDRNGIGSMPGDKRIRLTLVRLRETGYTSELSQRVELFQPSV